MMSRGWPQAFPLAIVGLLVFTACGGAATSTPTLAGSAPFPIATAAAQTAQPSAPAAKMELPLTEEEILKNTQYPPDKVRKFISENFYLAGMQYGKGQTPQYGGTAIFTHRMDIPSSDPMVTSTISLTGLTKQITGVGNLVRPNQANNWETEAYLAQSWETSSDFKVWTFRLRPDIKWHDGSPLTAQDIKFWIDLSVFPPPGRKESAAADNFGPLKEIQVIDPLTVRFIEKEPTPFLLETLMTHTTTLTHKRDLAQAQLDKGNLKVNMSDQGWISVGPFKIDKYDVGSRFKVVRNPYYFEKDDQGRQMPYLDGIDNPIIPDANTGVSAFRAGRTDRTAAGSGYHVSPGHVTAIKKDLGNKVWFSRSFYSTWGLGINSTVAPFNDIKLRKAVQLYIDRDEWSALAYGGFAQTSGMVVPGSFWANPDVLNWPGLNPKTKKQDREEALRLVKESGYDGARFGILCRDNYLFNAEAGDSQLRQMGLNSFIDIVDTNRNTEREQSGQYQLVLASNSASLPGRMLLLWVTSNPFSTNKTGDIKFDEYHKLLTTVVDPVKRRNVLWEVERYILQEKYYSIPGPREEATVAIRAYIKGMYVSGDSPLQNNSHQTVWMDQKMR